MRGIPVKTFVENPSPPGLNGPLHPCLSCLKGRNPVLKLANLFRFLSLRSFRDFCDCFIRGCCQLQMNSPSGSVQLIICDYVYCID